MCKNNHISTRNKWGKCRECTRLTARQRKRHPDYQKKYDHTRYHTNIDFERNRARIYRKNNPQKVSASLQKYRDNNRELLNSRAKIYSKKPETRMRNKERRKNDPQFLIKGRLRCRVNDALRRIGKTKTLHTMELIGCTIEQLVSHLESLFTEGMSWDNRNLWHIDHIRPCSSFDLTNANQQKECFHYTNLQPLWAVDNLKKGNKII